MKMTIETITPTTAAKMLAKNNDNRYIRQTNVKHYSDIMKKGEWKITPDAPISFSTTGRLLNGQHRLHAVIDSQMNIDFVVWREVDDNTFDVIDTGVKRTGGDVLQIAGLKTNNYKEAASIARSVIMYLDTMNSRWLSGGTGGAKSNKCNNHDLIDFIQSYNNELSEATDKAMQWYRQFKGITTTTTGAILIVLPDMSKPKFIEFMDSLCAGTNLSADSPIHQFRQLVLADGLRGQKHDRMMRTAMFLRTWEMHAKNKPCKRLIKTFEEFPSLYIGKAKGGKS